MGAGERVELSYLQLVVERHVLVAGAELDPLGTADRVRQQATDLTVDLPKAKFLLHESARERVLRDEEAARHDGNLAPERAPIPS